MRIARLLSESPDDKFKVLGLTFTSKAAAEMRERVEQYVPEQRHRVLLTTFHSFAAEVLRQHGSSVGIDPTFTILNLDTDRAAVVEEAIREAKVAWTKERAPATKWSTDLDLERDPKDLLRLIDHRFAQGFDVDEGTALQGMPSWFGPLFAAYQLRLLDSNRADFATLLWLCHRLIIERKAVARQMRLVYRYICVDEFQDTNLAQYKLLKALVGPAPANLFVVADDDQIIYQWNGASPERLAVLRDEYAMEVVQLPENYRCPPDVLGLANALIRHNRSRSPDKLPLVAKKSPAEGQSYRLFRFSDEEAEASWIATDIRNRCLAPGSCVVLARTNKLIDAVASATNRQGIPAHVTQRKSEFQSAPMRWLHGVLRLANERQNAEQLRRICKAWFELTQAELRPEELTARSVGGDFLRSWSEVATGEGSTAEMLEVLHRSLVDRVEFMRFVVSATAWLELIHQALGGEGFADFEEELATWKELQGRIVGQVGLDEITLHQFLQEMDLESKAPSPPPNALRCMTVHGSKGLEFEHVYLVGLAEDELPSFQARKRGDYSREMEEERRNCFVAITRVESTLTMTFSQSYRGWRRAPSRFLVEMGFSFD